VLGQNNQDSIMNKYNVYKLTDTLNSDRQISKNIQIELIHYLRNSHNFANLFLKKKEIPIESDSTVDVHIWTIEALKEEFEISVVNNDEDDTNDRFVLGPYGGSSENGDFFATYSKSKNKFVGAYMLE
jgi:O-phosphoseryl-tRNA(Cys) synthetase